MFAFCRPVGKVALHRRHPDAPRLPRVIERRAAFARRWLPHRFRPPAKDSRHQNLRPLAARPGRENSPWIGRRRFARADQFGEHPLLLAQLHHHLRRRCGRPGDVLRSRFLHREIHNADANPHRRQRGPRLGMRPELSRELGAKPRAPGMMREARCAHRRLRLAGGRENLPPPSRRQRPQRLALQT